MLRALEKGLWTCLVLLACMALVPPTQAKPLFVGLCAGILIATIWDWA